MVRVEGSLPVAEAPKPAHHRRMRVEVVRSAERMDAVAWARRYVLAVLRLEGVRPAASHSPENGQS